MEKKKIHGGHFLLMIRATAKARNTPRMVRSDDESLMVQPSKVSAWIRSLIYSVTSEGLSAYAIKASPS